MDDPRATIHSLVRRNLGPARPAKAVPAHVNARMSPDEAFRATLSDCVAQITANAAVLRSGRSVEGLHQLRVAFRRLEVALGAFGREFEQGWLEELRGRAKILSRRLGPARELDVFVGETLQGREGEGFAHLRACAEEARDTAWLAVNACIEGRDLSALLDDMAALASSQLPLARRGRLPRTAGRMLDSQARRVKKRGRAAAKGGEEADLHRLRIALKKLRYTAEFFAPLYPRKKVQRYLKKVRALQERLGLLNDAHNVRSVVSQILAAPPAKAGLDGPMRYAAGTLVGWHGAKAPRAAKTALKRYARLKKSAPFWR